MRTVHLRRRGRPTIYWSNCEQQARCCGGEPQPDEDGDCHFWAFVTSLILDVRNRGEKRRRRRRLFIHRPLSKADQRSKGKLGCESETHGIFSQVRDLKMRHQILILEKNSFCTQKMYSSIVSSDKQDSLLFKRPDCGKITHASSISRRILSISICGSPFRSRRSFPFDRAD